MSIDLFFFFFRHKNECFVLADLEGVVMQLPSLIKVKGHTEKKHIGDVFLSHVTDFPEKEKISEKDRLL